MDVDIALGTLDSVKIIGVSMPFEEAFRQQELDRMELAFQDARAKGIKPQAVYVVNPHNPYGRCYPKDILEGYVRFAEQLHLVSDEIYALSVFPSSDVPNPEPFRSILSLDLEKLKIKKERVHILYGMIHTRNATLNQSLLATSIFSIVASPTAELWASLLNENKDVEKYVKENRDELSISYEHLTSWLNFHGIPYTPNYAGHFLMVDLRGVLSSPSSLRALGICETSTTLDRVNAFLSHLSADPYKVVLGSGIGFHMSEPGWYRWTFSIPRWIVDTGLRRVEEAMGWDRWPEMEKGEERGNHNQTTF